MSDRTTINVSKKMHKQAKAIKRVHGETWPMVLEFYIKYRPQVDSCGLDVSNDGIDIDGLVGSLEGRKSNMNIDILKRGGPTARGELPRDVRQCDRIAGVWIFGKRGWEGHQGQLNSICYLPEEHEKENVIRTWIEANPCILESPRVVVA